MKHTYRLFRNLTACAGFLLIFGAAGTDEMYAEMGKMPPESLDVMVAVGLILLIPAALRLIGMALRKEKQNVHR